MMKTLKEEMGKTRDLKEKTEKELRQRKVTGSSGAGMVEIKVNAMYEVEDVSINESLLSPENKSMLETLITSAFNEAGTRIEEIKKEVASASLQRLFGGEQR